LFHCKIAESVRRSYSYSLFLNTLNCEWEFIYKLIYDRTQPYPMTL
jgi:hypothetical protein